MRNYLDELNEPQREAVTHKDGPLMIIAGAGYTLGIATTFKVIAITA